MTDEQIVKALECCSKAETRNECEQLKCPACKDVGCFFSTDVDNEDFIDVQKGLCSRVINLIKLKDEMLSAQASKIFLYEDVLKEKTEEIKRLKSLSTSNYKVWTVRDKALVLTDTLEDYEQFKRSIESEARKELAKRLKAMPSIQNCEYEWIYTDIDNLVKEMTEQKNDFKE